MRLRREQTGRARLALTFVVEVTYFLLKMLLYTHRTVNCNDQSGLFNNPDGEEYS